ncbi:MAG: glycosyltransferase [Candidatus Bathyarchaeia archaeon]
MKVGVISVYPPSRLKHSKHSGVASYTKNLVVSLLENCQVDVFADKIPHTTDYYGEGEKVYRCWNKGVFYPFQIFKQLLRKNVDVVHIQHEIYLYGGFGSAIIFPFLLFLIRLLRKPVVVTLHGVIPLSKIDERFLKENWIRGRPFVMKIGLTLLVKIIVFLSTAIIVHEESSKETLKSEYRCPPRKIFVIHHGVEEGSDLIEKDEAKRNLGLSGKNLILFFGYIAGYKNVELLIESAKFLKTSNWVLIIAGGLHPRLNGDREYLSYVSSLHEKASEISKDRILFKGFISEGEIPLYFSAADLIVFPYKISMHSSGPLALAASYGKPFLISDMFSEVIFFREAVFKNDPKELAGKIDRFFGDAEFQSKVLRCSEEFKMKRLWSDVARKTCELYREVVSQK